MKIIFMSHANETHVHMKGFALGLVLKVRVLESEMAYLHFISWASRLLGFYCIAPSFQASFATCNASPVT